MKYKENNENLQKEISKPHPDWQINLSYFKRFAWPEHAMQWYENIPTCAIFKTEQEQTYRWPGGQRAVSVIVTTILDFHEPEVIFKKKTIELAKVMNLSIQEPKKHVLFAQG